MKIINKNLVPDSNGNYLVSLCTLGVVARCHNLIDIIDGVNLGTFNSFGLAGDRQIFRIMHISICHDKQYGCFLSAVIQPHGQDCNLLVNALENDGISFKPIFQSNDPSNKLISFELEINE